MRARPLIFVYGTLRPGSGHPNAARLLREALHLGPARASGALWKIVRYPGFVPGPRGTVRGDLLRLHDGASLGWIDAYEMCGPDDPTPHPYRRITIAVRHRGRIVRAGSYAWVAPTRGLRRVPGGDWLRRRRQ